MLHILFDCEADGPMPPTYSMISFGAVLFEDQSKTFYGELAPISDNFIPKALAVSGFTREQTLAFENPESVMIRFDQWVTDIRKEYGNAHVKFVADNAGFDWSFFNYYAHRFVGNNQFGFSPMSLTWLYKGIQKDGRANFKHLRKTKHTHNALDDARGNAEALEAIIKRTGYRL